MAASDLSEHPGGGIGSVDADREAPKVPAMIDPNDPTGLLPVTALAQDLVCTYVGWNFSTAPGRTDRVELGWQTKGGVFIVVNSKAYPTPIDPSQFPDSLTVPRALLQEGVFEVSTQVVVGGNSVESLRREVTIDVTAPNFGQQPPAAIFPPELGGTLTEAYLIQHGQVVVLVPMYADVMAQDRAIYYWTDQLIPPDTEVPIREQAFSQQDIDNGRLPITLYANEIRPLGSGVRYVYYRLRDRAGNLGQRSVMSPITVDLTPAPGNLQPPRVPLTARGLIDREHARSTVQVEIDAYANPNPNQWVAVSWNGSALTEFPVDPSGFPLQTTVPWAILRAQGLGPLQARVDYRIKQGSFYTPPSPNISVPVDLTIAGQDHANAPALLNPNLALLEIRGAVSNTPNTLTGADFGLDATATLALYDDPQPGQVLELFWGAIALPVDDYTVQQGDVPGQILTFTVPWSAIDPDRENPALPVWYTTSNGVNQQLAPSTLVNVAIVRIDDLKEPSFPHANRYGYLNCCARPRVWEGVTVTVPPSPHFAAGDTVVLTWQGCRGLNGTDPIPGARAQFTHTLTAQQAQDGFDTTVLPYEGLIEPMVNNGSGLAFYDLIKSGVPVGTSAEDFVKISRTMPSGEVCSPGHETCTENILE